MRSSNEQREPVTRWQRREVSQGKPAHILRYFAYSHLRSPLKEISEAIFVLAEEMDATLPECAEKSAGLRKLLEAKDCFVRSMLEEKK